MSSLTPNYGLTKEDATDPFGSFRQNYNNNMDIIDQNLGGGGGSGGHTIIDQSGNAMPSRTGLQFIGASVTDNSVNDKTVVTVTGGGGGHNYSTSEQVVGTWINNKPLYEKTFEHSGALIVDNSFANDIGSLVNVDQFIGCEGYFRRTNANGLMYSLNGGTRPEGSADNKVSARYYNGNVQVAVNGYNDIEYIALTVRYTKTTD